MIGTNKDVDGQSNSDLHIFDNMQENVIIYKIVQDIPDIATDLRVKYVNNAAIINRRVPEEAIDKTVAELYDADIAALHLKMANKILKSGEGRKYKAYFESLNRYFSVSAYSPNDSTYVTISTDITKYKKLEGELRQAREDLEEKVEERTAKLEESNETLKNEIKERKLVEETLRRSEHKFRSVIKQSYNGVRLCDEQGVVIECNKAHEKIIGVNRDEIIGKFVWDVLFNFAIEERKTPEVYEHIKAASLKVFETGKIPWDRVREVEIQRPDGEHRFIEEMVFTIPTDKGFMACGIIRDITDRKKMEESVRESEEKFREIFNNANDMITLAESRKDTSSKYVEVNEVGCERLGYTKDEFLNLTASDIIAPEARAEMGKNSAKIAKSGRVKFEIVHMAKNGERIPVEVNLHSFKLRGKDVKLAISRDIREHKKMEETLHKGEQKFKSIFEQAPNGIMLCDEHGKIIEWNKMHEMITGIKQDEAVGKFIWDVSFCITIEEHKTPEAYEYMKAAHLEIFKTGKVPWNNQMREVEIQRPDGKRCFVEQLVSTIRTDKGFMACGIIQDITNRRKMEETLMENEQKFRSVIEQSYNGIALCDEQGKIVEWNKAQEKIIGLKQDEAVGKFLWDMLFQLTIEERRTPEVYENLKMAIQKVFRTGKAPLNTHTRAIQRPDGECRFVEQQISTIWTDKGFMGCAIVQDITTRKKMEETLRKSERKFRSVIEQSYNGITLCDEQGMIIEWNEAQERITGIKRDEAVGKFVWDVSFQTVPQERKTSEMYEYMKVGMLKLFKTGKLPWNSPVLERKIQKPDGKRNFVEQLVFTIRTDKGFMVCTLFQDITDRKRIEDALKESEEKFRETLQQSYDGIAIANERGNIIEWNPALEQITGRKKEDMVGKFVWDMQYEVSPEEKQTLELVEKLKFILIPLLEGDAVINRNQMLDREIQHPDGKRIFVQSTNFPIKTKKGIMLGSFNRDITERKKAEKQLKETVEELKRSNEELQRFAYVASHDLQEPLRTIASFTQLLEKRYKGRFDSDADEFMDYIVEAAVRMKELIGALLDYSRITTKVAEFKSVDCGSILDQTIDNLQYTIKESNAKVTYDPMPVVVGNEVQLQRVFQNLISNAIKFKKEEKSLEVHISAINDEVNKEYVFEVTDNGIGIEEEYFDRIFTIFQRLHTRDEYSGTGIGLSVVKRIIERHGGRIWVESESGVGSTFYFAIPY